ncbi:hypothetical protein O0I10_009404 [Lichtheimia ornata]|uniref:Uncharacterized protein n=1 Tax=Lichtheimia ornata TaxID=688661 RepID=A0AAD7UWM7_9FUNG|nr:uncharacterized protein O0I10_009404 [Lichtheimia ornata]KAJ8655008.1 hypothetical protein O0I10_009404 [Lichtheimia ornata]
MPRGRPELAPMKAFKFEETSGNPSLTSCSNCVRQHMNIECKNCAPWKGLTRVLQTALLLLVHGVLTTSLAEEMSLGTGSMAHERAINEGHDFLEQVATTNGDTRQNTLAFAASRFKGCTKSWGDITNKSK